MNALFQLHADIDARVRTIRDDHPGWLCRKGCDRCCRQLAEVPRLTDAEWDVLRAGLATLPPARLAEIRRDVAALAAESAGPVVCPLLERASGACSVYVQRPVACRTYGFYVQRHLGMYCGDIESRVADGALADVVWGNHDAVDHRLADMGDVRTLAHWFDQWEPEA
jgi:Fe-S-cluster containining protein